MISIAPMALSRTGSHSTSRNTLALQTRRKRESYGAAAFQADVESWQRVTKLFARKKTRRMHASLAESQCSPRGPVGEVESETGGVGGRFGVHTDEGPERKGRRPWRAQEDRMQTGAREPGVGSTHMACAAKDVGRGSGARERVLSARAAAGAGQ